MQLNVTQTECKRCGKCCTAGGPVLHSEDRDLIVSGKLNPKDLITFRRGEVAFDPVKNSITVIGQELIKIKGAGKIGACKFYHEDKGCTIYAFRPLECRLLRCWDTSELQAIYMKDLLKRLDLVPQGSVLYELIVKHEDAFDLNRIAAGLNDEKDIEGKYKAINHIAEQESGFRDSVIVHYNMRVDELDFFFGRQVREVLSFLLDN